MEKFYITFHMNNGDKIDFEEQNDPSFSVFNEIKRSGKWMERNNHIINLDNVNAVFVETETQRIKKDKETAEAYSDWNN